MRGQREVDILLGDFGENIEARHTKRGCTHVIFTGLIPTIARQESLHPSSLFSRVATTDQHICCDSLAITRLNVDGVTTVMMAWPLEQSGTHQVSWPSRENIASIIELLHILFCLSHPPIAGSAYVAGDFRHGN